MDRKTRRAIIKEFTEKACSKCKSYVVCGGECAGCVDFNKFLKEKGYDSIL